MNGLSLDLFSIMKKVLFLLRNIIFYDWIVINYVFSPRGPLFIFHLIKDVLAFSPGLGIP